MKTDKRNKYKMNEIKAEEIQYATMQSSYYFF